MQVFFKIYGTGNYWTKRFKKFIPGGKKPCRYVIKLSTDDKYVLKLPNSSVDTRRN